MKICILFCFVSLKSVLFNSLCVFDAYFSASRVHGVCQTVSANGRPLPIHPPPFLSHSVPLSLAIQRDWCVCVVCYLACTCFTCVEYKPVKQRQTVTLGSFLSESFHLCLLMISFGLLRSPSPPSPSVSLSTNFNSSLSLSLQSLLAWLFEYCVSDYLSVSVLSYPDDPVDQGTELN